MSDFPIIWDFIQCSHSLPQQMPFLECQSQCWCLHAGFGFGVWAIASVGCGLAPNFWILLLCRVIMGAGEASIITLTGPFIDDVAPPAQKTLWFGVLNLVGPPLHLAAISEYPRQNYTPKRQLVHPLIGVHATNTCCFAPGICCMFYECRPCMYGKQDPWQALNHVAVCTTSFSSTCGEPWSPG